MKIRNAMMAICFAGAFGAAAEGRAQTAAAVVPVDSAVAMMDGRVAAKKELVVGYFLAGVATGPVAVGSIAVLVSGGEPSAVVIGSPLVLFAVGAKAAHTGPLPREVKSLLEDKDSAYVRVFTKSYDRTLKKRRQSALGLGALTGMLGSVLLLAISFRNYS